jgi:hypothetical protein
LKVRTRALIAVAIVGMGLLIGSQITAGGVTEVTSPAEASPSILQNTYLLIPTTDSVSVASLNGSAYLIVAQMTGNQSNLSPIVNTSVIQKDIVTFTIPMRGYYEVEFVTSSGITPAVTFSLTETGRPPDQTSFGATVFIAGLIGAALVTVFSKRESQEMSQIRQTSNTYDPG